MRFDVFCEGKFLMHLPMWSWEVDDRIKEIEAVFVCEVTIDDYSKRIELR